MTSAAHGGSPRSAWRARNVVMLGVVSLLTDAATEMIIPLLPLFVTVELGGGALALGWIEGLAEAVASALKLISGRAADRVGSNRPFVVAGYGIASLARPFIAIAGAVWHVAAIRVVDRIGKGLRTSPRDALIAASVPADQRGAAFGLHRAMDHLGAILGSATAAALLAFAAADVRTIFWLTAVPGALAVLVVTLGVRERPRDPDRRVGAPGVGAGPRRLAPALVPMALFTLGNASDVFLLLKAGQARAPIATLPLLWLALHLVKSVTSIPGGVLADRWGQRKVLALGWLVYAAIYAAFAFAESATAVAILFVVYGAYHGLTEAAEKSLIAGLAPARSRGTAFGWYHATLGLCSLAASAIFGALWDYAGSRTAFLFGAALALAGTLALAALAPRQRAG